MACKYIYNNQKYTFEQLLEVIRNEGSKDSSQISSFNKTVSTGFLNDFGIDVQEYENIKDALGYDSTQMVDMVSKFIALEKGQLLDKSTAYLAFMLLGKENNKVRSDLRYNIYSWDKYKERFDFHKKELFNEEGFIENQKDWKNKVRDRIVIDYLGETLVNYYNDPVTFEKVGRERWSAKDFTFIKKLYDMLKKFFQKVGILSKDTNRLSDIANSIAHEILNQEYDIYDYKLDPEQVKKEYEETVNQDLKAKDIINFHRDNDIVLTGSLALRRAGSVYRTKEETLHDLDFVVPFNLSNNDPSFNKIKNNILTAAKIKPDIDTRVIFAERMISEFIQKSEWFTNFIEKYPTYKFLTGFVGSEHSEKLQSITMTGVIDGEFDKDGNYIKGTGYIIDHFVRLADSQEEHENYFKLWKEIVIAKLNMSRGKDIIDYKYFLPNSKSKDKFNFYYKDWVYSVGSKVRNTPQLMYSLNESKVGEISTKIETKLKEFLTRAGFETESLDNYKKRLTTMDESFSEEGVSAVIDLTNGVIATNNGTKNYSFVEEVAHLAVELSPKDSKMNRALELVVDTDLYRNVSEEYRDKYKNDRPELTSDELETLVRKEIVGKKIANHVFNMTRNDMSSRLYRTLQSIWDSFLKMFKKGPVNELNDYIVKVSKELLNSNSNFFTGEIGKGVMYELDLNEYKKSSVLNGYKENLEDAIRTRIKKLKIFQTKGKKSVTEAEKKTIKDLTESLQKDKITYGLVEFVNIAGSEAASTIKRLKELQENYDKKTPKEIASTLNNMNNYIAAYGPILENIKSDLDLDRDNEETKEILRELKTILNDIDTLQDQYYKIGIPLFANVLFPFISRNPNFDSVEKVIEILKEAPEDISIFRKFLDSMAESHDDILASVDQLVKLHKERARLQSENEIRDLVKLNMQLKAIGVNNTEWMAELDDDGVPTGFFVSNREMGRFKKNVAKFMKDLNSDFGYSNDPEERRNQLMNDSKKNRKAYKKAVQDFFEEHTELNPDFDDIIKDKLTNIYNDVFDEHEKSKEIFDYILNNVAPDLFPAVPKIKETRKISRVADLFQEWLDENRTWSDYTEEFYYGKALTQPSKELYSSNQYADIFKDPLKSEYYNKVMDLKKDKDNHLPGFFTSNLLMPQIRKDFVERLLSDPKSTLKSVGDSFKSREDDHEFGMGYSLTDERNRPVELLPVYFTRAIKDRKDLSLDVTATMAAYIDMANNYKEMNEIVDIIELGDEVLSQRDIAVGTDLLSKTEELFSNKKTIAEQKGGNSYERYKSYTSMSVYGKMKENETWLAPLGLNTSKVVDTFNMYTAIQGLGLNIYSAIANPILGNIMVRQERVAKQFIKEGSLTFADKTYFSELPKLLGDMHSLETDSKLRLFGEYVNVLQDYKSRLFELNTDRNHWGRMFNTSSLFFLNHAGEHQIQYRMALAMAHGYEVELNGETINLWDALDVKDNKLIIKAGAKNKDGSPLTLENLSSFGLRLQSVNQRLHGIYNDIDRSVIQKWSLGRMAILFRKFIKPGFNRRFDKKHFNYQSDTLDEGMYRTTARFMKTLYSELKAGQLSIAANWEKLTDEEKANIRRTIVEANYMLAATILAGILSSIAGDDDDNWKLNLAAYQANRIYSELRFYTSPGEALRILKSPAAGINQLQTLTGYFNILDPYGAIFDEDPFLKTYKGGKNKGQTYLWVTTKKSFVPTLKNVENWFTPEEQLKLYMQ